MFFMHVCIILHQAGSHEEPQVGEWWCCCVEDTTPQQRNADGEEEYLAIIESVNKDGSFNIEDVVECEKEKSIGRGRFLEWCDPKNINAELVEGFHSKPLCFFCVVI